LLLFTTNDCAGTPPKVTELAPEKSAPVIITGVEPEQPDDGLKPEMVGGLTTKFEMVAEKPAPITEPSDVNRMVSAPVVDVRTGGNAAPLP
jgi:hypothetical protein